MTTNQLIWFNGLVVCLWLSYDKACTTEAAPKGWVKKALPEVDDSDDEGEVKLKGVRW